MFMTNISLLWLRNASRAYDNVEKIPIKTPNIITPCKKAHTSAAAPISMV